MTTRTPSAATPLVESKLAPPRAKPDEILRKRLVDELDRLSSVALTLVCAPAGCGKTVLLESWVARAGGAVAWVSLEPADDGPARFWTYVATAVDRVRQGLGRGALGLLRSTRATPERVAEELANGLQAYGAPVTLVLDDAHVISDDRCWGSLEHLVDRLPRQARLVVATRMDPPLSQARLRAQGVLAELRAPSLAFTLDEARELLVGRQRIALDDVDVELLVERTEGWPAALHLAALWLRELDDPHEGVQAFHANHRHVADYLTTEVLDLLDDDARRFMLETSVLGVFSPGLCDSVLGRADSAERLHAIERENGFLRALDATGDWYRYHHLFGELLELELSRVDPAAPARIHRRASEWCLEHDLLERALDHAAAAGDASLVATILASEHRSLLRSGALASLLRWCDWLPEDELAERPEVAIAGALAAGLVGLEPHARHRLEAVAERARAERPEVWSPYHEAALALARITWVETDLGASLAVARATLDTARGVHEVAVPFIASLAFLLFLAGEGDEALGAVDEALDRPEAPSRPHGLVVALATQALVEAASGRTEAAEQHAQQAVGSARSAGIRESVSGGIARVSRAVALAARGRLAEAERDADEGERLCRSPGPDAIHVHALIVRAGIRARRGRLEPAAADLENARAGLRAFTDAGMLPELAAVVERTLERARAAAAAVFEQPSEAELNVLRLLATELSQREIGEHLYLSVNTIKTHTRTLYRKLGVTSREEAVARATVLGLLHSSGSPG